MIHALGDVVDALEAAVGDPLADVLVALLAPLGDVGVEDQEPLPFQAAAHDLPVVLDAVVVRHGLVVVRGDGAAGDDAAKLVHVVQGHVQEVAAHVVVEDVDPVGREALERRVQIFLFVVEARGEAQVFGDEGQFGVVADGADDLFRFWWLVLFWGQ